MQCILVSISDYFKFIISKTSASLVDVFIYVVYADYLLLKLAQSAIKLLRFSR